MHTVLSILETLSFALKSLIEAEKPNGKSFEMGKLCTFKMWSVYTLGWP